MKGLDEMLTNDIEMGKIPTRDTYYSSKRSDFVTNSYGESWDSSCGKPWVPVQNHWAPVQKTMSSWVFCNHTVNLEADSKILYYGLVKIYSLYRKVQQRLTEIYLVKQQPQEQPQKSHKQDIPQKHFQIDWAWHPTRCMPQIILHLWHFLCVRDAGRRGNEITEMWNDHTWNSD